MPPPDGVHIPHLARVLTVLSLIVCVPPLSLMALTGRGSTASLRGRALTHIEVAWRGRGLVVGGVGHLGICKDGSSMNHCCVQVAKYYLCC